MATLVGSRAGFDIGDILIVIVPASIVAVIVSSFVQMKWGADLDEDVEYQRPGCG